MKKQDLNISNTIVSKYQYSEEYTKELDFCKELDWQKYEEGRVESSFDRAVIFHPELDKLYKFVQNCIDEYVLNALRTDSKLVISQSWVGKQSKNQSVTNHRHISAINGCFYFNVPDASTPLVFNLTNAIGLTDEFSIPVTSGELILFPNELEHWVPTNESEDVRYVLGLNTMNLEQRDEYKAIGKFYNSLP